MFSIDHNAVTRSHKQNDRDHAGLAAGTAQPEEHLPRYFAKHGHVDSAPNKVKKEGAGKANWGTPGEEAADYGYTMAKPRRRSNSTATGAEGFKTKFETNEADPMFEEDVHGPVTDDDSAATGSTGAGSVEEEDIAKKE